MLDAPVLIWTLKLSPIRNGQYLDGRLLGNSWCCCFGFGGPSPIGPPSLVVFLVPVSARPSLRGRINTTKEEKSRWNRFEPGTSWIVSPRLNHLAYPKLSYQSQLLKPTLAERNRFKFLRWPKLIFPPVSRLTRPTKVFLLYPRLMAVARAWWPRR